MKIKYFAWIKDITHCEEEEISSKKIDDLDKLKIFIKKKYPSLIKYLDKEILRFAVNQEYTINNISLNNKDEIAIFPPVSGG